MRMPSKELRNSLESLISQYEAQAGPALTYLAQRGISEDTARRFRLGWTGHGGQYANRLAIPYLTPAGPWHVKYRALDPGATAKYLYDPGNIQHLYNTETLLDADTVVVVEGELDAIAVEQAGVAAVGYPGAQVWGKNRHWRWVFDSVDEIVIVADGDEPGEKAAHTVAASLRDSVTADIRVVQMPPGHDANSFINSEGENPFLYQLGLL